MLTEAQLQERKSYVTGTDAGAILGVNPYMSIVDCWNYKLGFSSPPDLSENQAVRAGIYLEPVVRQMFEDTTGKAVTLLPDLQVHKEHKFMAGTLDGWIESECAVFEAKTARFAHGWGEQGEALIPTQYLCQLVHYMAVKDAAYGYVAVLIGGSDFRYYLIDRSEKLEKVLIEKEGEFWDKNVLGLTPPDPKTYDDVVNLYRGKTLTNPIKAHDGIINTLNLLKHIRNAQKENTEQEKAFKQEIALYMRDHVELINRDEVPLATFKYNKDSQRFDAKRFEKENPELYQQYLQTTPGSRVLKIKGITDD